MFHYLKLLNSLKKYKMFKNITYILLVTCVIFSCDNDNEEDNLPPLPIVETVGSQVFSSGGVTLQGNISNLGDNQITAFGFEVETQGNNVYYNVNHQVTLPATQGIFVVEILQGLYPDLEYHFTAYVTTDLDTYRGETLSFFSNGSANPIMELCTPNIAHIGDTVVLSGENFPTDINELELKFGDSYAQIESTTETEITFTVPRPEGDLRGLEISSYGNQVIENGLLDLHQPIITSTNPATAFFGETISIIGDHFNNNIYSTSVSIGGIDAQVLSTSRNEIQVIIPEDVNYSNSIITVYAQNQYVNYNNFNIKVPEFVTVPNQVYTDQNFLVTVDQTYENKNLFLIDGKEYYPTIIDDTTLQFYIYSSQSFVQRDITLKWVINDIEVVSDQLLNLSNPYYKVKDGYNNNFPFAKYDVFTINNEAVIIGDIAYTNPLKYIYKYNDVTRTWTNQSQLNSNGSPYSFGSGGASFVYSENTNLIFGLRSNGFAQDFIQVDISTGNVTELTPNNQSNYYGKGFAYQNKVFYTMPLTSDLWAYDINNQTWSVISTLPYNITQYRNQYITPIVVGDYVYIANGSDDSQFNDFLRMNLITYQWEQLSNNPSPSKSAAVYLRNNQLHFVGTEVWKYDLVTQNWGIMPNSGITNNPYDHGTDVFIQNNIPYVIYREDFTNVSYLNLFFGDLVD